MADPKWRLYNGHLQTTDHRPDGKWMCTRCPFCTPNPHRHDHNPCTPELCPFSEINEKAGGKLEVKIKCSERDVTIPLESIIWDPTGPGYNGEHHEM